MEEIKKTSQAWLNDVPKELGLIITDYEGWDQMKYVFSFLEENITKKEFLEKLMNSEYNTTPEIEDFLEQWKSN